MKNKDHIPFKYQFLYWNDINRDHDQLTIITAFSLKSACVKFMRNRKYSDKNLLVIDYEVLNLTTDKMLNISEIDSIKEYLS